MVQINLLNCAFFSFYLLSSFFLLNWNVFKKLHDRYIKWSATLMRRKGTRDRTGVLKNKEIHFDRKFTLCYILKWRPWTMIIIKCARNLEECRFHKSLGGIIIQQFRGNGKHCPSKWWNESGGDTETRPGSAACRLIFTLWHCFKLEIKQAVWVYRGYSSGISD